MKFGETFTVYLHGDQETVLEKYSHVEYKRLKKVLKSCRSWRSLESSSSSADPDNCHNDNDNDTDTDNKHKELCLYGACPLCDQMFFTELMKESSDIAECFSARVRHLLHLRVAGGVQRYILRLRQCFKGNNQVMLQEGRMLIEYITMNAIAIRKILKKYDKVHGSVNGKNFRSKMRAEHIELLQSPWLIELGAFYMNFRGLDAEESKEGLIHFSFDLDVARPVMAMLLADSIKLEYDLTCAVCLETVFNPYALSCGHLFCKSCACSAASVMIFQGLKAAGQDAKCPVCREVGVYKNSVHMLELDLLLKRRCKDYWKERMNTERCEIVKQSKDYWEQQTQYAVGY